VEVALKLSDWKLKFHSIFSEEKFQLKVHGKPRKPEPKFTNLPTHSNKAKLHDFHDFFEW
jgi:hypothetical protein